MAAIVGQESIAGGYIGTASATAIYVGATLMWSASTPTPPTPPAYTIIPNGIRKEDAPDWNLDDYIDTGVYVPSQSNTTIRMRYIGGGVFSDRIVGFDAIECGSDDEDFRYFPELADAGNLRINDAPSYLYRRGRQRDITFGNLWIYDNIEEQMLNDYGQSGSPIDINTTIRIDMSTNWMQEVAIYDNGVAVWSGVSAYYDGEYGFYDTVGNTFHTNTGLTLVSGGVIETGTAVWLDYGMPPDWSTGNELWFSAATYTLEEYDEEYDDMTGETTITEVPVASVTIQLEGEDYCLEEQYGIWGWSAQTFYSGITENYFVPYICIEYEFNTNQGWHIYGNFDETKNYRIKCSAITSDGAERWGYAADVNDGGKDFDLVTNDIIAGVNFDEHAIFPLRTLTITGITPMSVGDYITITDGDKFGFEANYDDAEMQIITTAWTGDCWEDEQGGMEGDCCITVVYDEQEETLTVEGDWETYDPNGGVGDYILEMRFDPEGGCMDSSHTSLQWSDGEMSKTIAFDEGTPCGE